MGGMSNLNAANDINTTNMAPAKRPWLPPRWVIRTAWAVHRLIYRSSGGRSGLKLPSGDDYGTLRLSSIGRKTGRERGAMLGYFLDGPNFVTLAMNGWGEPEPAWWLNLQAHPDAVVDLVAGSQNVVARAAIGEERARLWARMGRGRFGSLDRWAALRSRETAVVVFEPGSTSQAGINQA
jgi:deazaflavin-dependent oxidoreductase (nitroreductase family)